MQYVMIIFYYIIYDIYCILFHLLLVSATSKRKGAGNDLPPRQLAGLRPE